MLKTIRKFVLERRRDVHRRRRPIVEDNDTRESQDASEAPLRPAEPQLDEPPVPTVWGEVKWYNPLKRYGFVELSDGYGDAFLHATALASINAGTLQPGVRLEFRLAPGQRGPQVTEILHVDTSTTAPSSPVRKSFRSQPERHPSEASVREMGTVKWYNVARGFGFIMMDGDATEVFVHASALDRSSISGLREGQRVFVEVAEGQRGPQAASVQLA